MVGQPGRQGRGARGGTIGVGQAGRHGPILVGGEQHIVQDEPEDAGKEGHGGTRHVDQAGPAADRTPDFADELGEGRAFRTDGVGDAVVRLPCLGQTEARQVVDMDAPDPVVASTADREDGEPAKQPGDVVEQHAVTTEEDGRANDRVRDVALGEGPLHERLAPEIRQRRAAAGMRDAHVHDPLDPRPLGRVEERPRVGDGQLVIDGATARTAPSRCCRASSPPRATPPGPGDRRSRAAARQSRSLGGARPGCPVRVRTWRPAWRSARGRGARPSS